MADQHDEGVFNPSAGDRLSLAGNITDWKASELFLEDENGDWKFTAALPSNTFEDSDTLDFKFVIINKENRDLPNSGWEVIPNWHITHNILQQQQPLFVFFNETWSPLVEKELTFRVNLANQQVLGFFASEAGDRVAVTGSFLGAEALEEQIVLAPTAPLCVPG